MNANLVSAEEIAALRAVESDDGELTPDLVVEAARDPENPLHDRFTWDDTEAGEKWRQHEARALLRLVRIEVRTETTTLLAPMYVHDPAAPSQSYRNTKTLMDSDPDRARAVLAYTVSVARGHLTRAQELAAIFGLDGQIGGMVKQLREIEDRLSEITAVGSDAAM